MSKTDPRIAAIGDVDETNSAIGLAIAALRAGMGGADGNMGWTAILLEHVQNDLFDLGADLATPGEDFTPSDMVLRITEAQVTRLEREIDGIVASIDPLRSFILPGGSPPAAALHLARAIARRAERSAVAAAEVMPLNRHALTYLNRLSDLLFVLARQVNKSGGGDVLWVPGATRSHKTDAVPATETP